MHTNTNMDFRTIVNLPPNNGNIALTPHSSVMLIGSCFADHIGQRLQQVLPQHQVCINPHGTLYNPMSILTVVRSLMKSEPTDAIDADGYFTTNEHAYRHWDYATSFTAPAKSELEDELIKKWHKAKAVFNNIDLLLITFSTDHVYWLNTTSQHTRIVANCHKQPSRMFYERVADEQTMLNEWAEVLAELQRQHPSVKVVFTLSPYRYAKYGMHENALSKARLLLLIDQLERLYNNVTYFPAYEIISDELRDYRFYAEDMLHPSEQAVSYVWERFSQWSFSPEMHEYAKEHAAIARAMNHRPLHPEGEEYKRFVERRELKKLAFEKKWNMSF